VGAARPGGSRTASPRGCPPRSDSNGVGPHARRHRRAGRTRRRRSLAPGSTARGALAGQWGCFLEHAGPVIGLTGRVSWFCSGVSPRVKRLGSKEPQDCTSVDKNAQCCQTKQQARCFVRADTARQLTPAVCVGLDAEVGNRDGRCKAVDCFTPILTGPFVYAHILA
jgi:hypothetical protein